jgi:hypothetical protein
MFYAATTAPGHAGRRQGHNGPGPALPLLRPARAPRPALPHRRKQRPHQLRLVRRLLQKTNLPILSRLREGKHHLQHRRNPLLHWLRPRPLGFRRPETGVSCAAGERGDVYVHQRQLFTCAESGFVEGDGQVVEWDYVGAGARVRLSDTDEGWEAGQDSGQVGESGEYVVWVDSGWHQ